MRSSEATSEIMLFEPHFSSRKAKNKNCIRTNLMKIDLEQADYAAHPTPKKNLHRACVGGMSRFYQEG